MVQCMMLCSSVQVSSAYILFNNVLVLQAVVCSNRKSKYLHIYSIFTVCGIFIEKMGNHGKYTDNLACFEELLKDENWKKTILSTLTVGFGVSFSKFADDTKLIDAVDTIEVEGCHPQGPK